MAYLDEAWYADQIARKTEELARWKKTKAGWNPMEYTKEHINQKIASIKGEIDELKARKTAAHIKQQEENRKQAEREREERQRQKEEEKRQREEAKSRANEERQSRSYSQSSYSAPEPVRPAPSRPVQTKKSPAEWDVDDYVDTYNLAKEKLQEPILSKMRGIPEPNEMVTAYVIASSYATTPETKNDILVRLREKIIAQCPAAARSREMDCLLDIQQHGKWRVGFLENYIIDHINYWSNPDIQEELPEICKQGAKKYKKQFIGQWIYICFAFIGLVWGITRWCMISGFWRCFGFILLAAIFIVVMYFIYLLYLDELPWKIDNLIHPLWKKK